MMQLYCGRKGNAMAHREGLNLPLARPIMAAPRLTRGRLT